MSMLRIPTPQFRTLPQPTGTGKVGLFFARAQNIPNELWDWRDVNPRDVKTTTKVYEAIMTTLMEEPERFAERNRGLTLSADEIEFDDKRREVLITLSDKKAHGVMDGGHTLHAVLEGKKLPRDNGWPADVFLKVITGIPKDQIAEIAGGLNRSQQVDLKSLENLKDHFAELQRVLKDQPYASKIAYKMNEEKPIDVREVLYYLAVFDAEAYDGEKHPTALFGRKEGIVSKFAAQAAGGTEAGDSFKILIARAPDILKLRDLIEKKALEDPNIGYFKAGKKERVRSPRHRKNELHFLNETVEGKIPLGWIMPMLGAFRANVDWNRPKGGFSWKVPVEQLLDSCVEGLVAGVKEIHARENARPEYVGRNATAWRVCYDRVRNAILEHELERARRGR